MKTLNINLLEQGVTSTIQDITICKSKIEELNRIIRQLITLDDVFKGNTAQSIRLFYATCHLPFLTAFQQFLHRYHQILLQLQTDVRSYEAGTNGYIEQAFIEGKIHPKLEQVADTVQHLTIKSNTAINEVSDIISLPRVNNQMVLEKVQEGKINLKKTIELLYELDSF